ncbi:MAG: nicotinamide riboside transporter PnuC [Bacteroidota bacterium]
MTFQEWLDRLVGQVSQTGLIEWAVLIFGVTEVLLAKANNILLYPAGIIATILSVTVLFQAQLYGESFLNMYYFVMSVYGWWFWIKKKNAPPVEISKADKKDWFITLLIALGGWIFLFFVLKNFTPSTVPAWDAWISSTAWAGMWLLARRKIENWILLNISNAFAIPLLFQKQLAMFSLLTIFLFVVACFGYADWMKKLKTRQQAADQ